MTCVVKIGGRAQRDPAFASAVAERARRGNGRVLVVHGGGDEVSALQRAFGHVPEFVDGRRVTTHADIALVRMVLSGSANKQLVADLAALGVRAVGVSGEDGPMIVAQREASGTLGQVGEPSTIDTSLIDLLMSNDYTPVVSPVSRAAETSGALNVNADDAAAAIAIAVGATELLLVSDVTAVRSEYGDVAHLSDNNVGKLLAGSDVSGGMRAKLEAAVAAARGGVGAVRICDVAGILDDARGTRVSLEGRE